MKINYFNLNNKYRLDHYKPASSLDDIAELKNSLQRNVIPSDYIMFVSQLTEAEILVSGDSYIRIWGALGCIEMNIEYNVQKYIPDAIAIGDDEGGKAIIYAKGSEGFGLYKVGFGDLDIDSAEFISPSLTDLLIYGNGAEKFI